MQVPNLKKFENICVYLPTAIDLAWLHFRRKLKTILPQVFRGFIVLYRIGIRILAIENKSVGNFMFFSCSCHTNVNRQRQVWYVTRDNDIC